MASRFRSLDGAGNEIEVGDLDDLRTAIQDGRVDEESILHDALTGVWAPASTHAAYQLLTDPLAHPPDESAASDVSDLAPSSPPSPDSALDIPDLEMTLVPSGDSESTEEVVEKLLKERKREEDDRVEPSRVVPQDGSAIPLTDLEGPTEDESLLPVEEPATEEPESHEPAKEWWEPSKRPAPPAADRPAPARVSRPPRRTPEPRRSKRARRPWMVPAGAAAVVLVGALYLGSRMFGSSDPEQASGTLTGELSATPLDAAGASTPWAGVEGVAFQDMMNAMDSLRRVHSVARIPSIWLSGPYLSDAGSYPDVEDYWQNYLSFVADLRLQDTVLFRRSFVTRLEDQDFSSSMISIRLARAMENFEASQPARDTVYERMGDLAGSALDLHALLEERNSDIYYDPVTDTTASQQPILEAWSDDEDLRASLWLLLDRITANLALLQLDAINSRSDLTERLFQELRSRSIPERNDED